MKGKEWYQVGEVTQEYDSEWFSKGGRLIDRREKEATLVAPGPVEDKNILEVACGTGRSAVILTRKEVNIVGLDISWAIMVQGWKKAYRADVANRIKFLRGDAARLPFPDDRLDAVFVTRFFHLADTPAKFLAEMARVSKGQVFFDISNDGSLRVTYNWLLLMGSRLYSERDMRRLFGDAGLDLAGAKHDFVIPLGFYREVPSGITQAFCSFDLVVGDSPLGDDLTFVSYRNARAESADESSRTAVQASDIERGVLTADSNTVLDSHLSTSTAAVGCGPLGYAPDA